MSHTAPQRNDAAVGEIRSFKISFAGRLDNGELLTGTPVIAEQTTSNLTITNQIVSTASLTINDITVATAEAVQFSASGMQAGVSYKVKITIGTDATPAQTLIGYIILDTE